MIVESLASNLVDFQLENPGKMLILIGLLTTILLPGALKLTVKPSTEAILPEDDPVVQSLDTLRAKFAGDITYIVMESDEDVRSNYLLTKTFRIDERLERAENVDKVVSPGSLVYRKYEKIPNDKDKLEEFNFRGLVTENHKTAVLSVRSDTQADSKEIQKLHNTISRTVESELPNQDYSLTGYNMIDLATFQVIISDFIRITAASFSAVLIVLYGVFRDVKRMFYPLVPVIFALLWMLGLGGYLGADLTIISMVSAAMIMGLGIDFGIHVTKKYFSTKRGAEGISETMVELSRGLLGGSTTTGVGFLALLFANLKGMHSLGIFLFTGIISAYLGAVLLLPTLIILIDGKTSVV